MKKKESLSEFKLIISEDNNSLWVEAYGADVSVSRQRFALDYWRFEDFDSYASLKEAEELGASLFNKVFNREVSRAYYSQRGNDKLLISLLIRGGAWLHRVPWELLFDELDGAFLAMRRDRLFVRSLDATTFPQKLTFSETPRILHVSSSPINMESLDIKKSDLGAALITELSKATPERLRDAIESQPFDILHLDGHGAFEEEEDTGVIFLEDETGFSRPMPAEVLGDYLAGTSIKLVVLSACETGRRGVRRYSGVAHRLVGSSAIPAVVAMQWPIADESASAFNKAFYKALARGDSIPEAIVKARWGMRDVSNPIEPLASALYMR